MSILLLVLICALGTGGSTAPASPAVQIDTPDSLLGDVQNARNKEEAAIGPVEFFASWNGVYNRLDRWKDSSDPKVPHPDVVDILFSVQNKGNSAFQEGDLFALTTVEFVVAPTYLHGGDVNKILKEVAWSRVSSMDDLKKEVVPAVKPGEKVQVKIRGLNLGKVIEQFSGTEDTLWPWAVRVNVHLLRRDMTTVTSDQLVLPLIPSDKRLGR